MTGATLTCGTGAALGAAASLRAQPLRISAVADAAASNIKEWRMDSPIRSFGSKRPSPPVGRRRGDIVVFGAHSAYAPAGEPRRCPPGGARLPRLSEGGVATGRAGDLAR